MIKIVPIIVVSLILLWRSLKLCKLTSYNLFFTGIILFLQVGYFLAYTDIDNNYVLKGDMGLLDGIYTEVLTFSCIAAFFLFFQDRHNVVHQANSYAGGLNIKIKIYQYVVLFVLLVLMLGVNFHEAPLLNIGKYTFEEMSEARNSFYDSGFSRATAIVRYVMFYLAVPSLFFLRGYGLNVSKIVLFVGLMLAILTLAKTATILLVVFYFFGKYLKSEQVRYLLMLLVTSSMVFYVIVYLTYFVSERREFWQVLYVFIKRLIVVPISLSAFYSENFAFEDGIRSSVYYTYLFGGRTEGISKIAAELITGIRMSDINAPTGIVGIAYPNIPSAFHFIYYLFFISIVFVVSCCASKIRNNLSRSTLSVLFGVSCWFILLTDPTTALNSYGGLYISIVIFLLYLKQTLGPLIVQRKFFNSV